MARNNNNSLKETGKFALRMVLFAVPIIISLLTDRGYVVEATALSSFIAVLDKYIHVSDIPFNGLVKF